MALNKARRRPSIRAFQTRAIWTMDSAHQAGYSMFPCHESPPLPQGRNNLQAYTRTRLFAGCATRRISSITFSHAGESLRRPYLMVLPLTIPPNRGGLVGLPLRASNEGFLKPRVARAQETRQATPPLSQHFDPSVRQASARSLNPELRRLSYTFCCRSISRS